MGLAETQRTAHRLQKDYADFIKSECRTGDHEADHRSADDAVMKYLAAIKCDDLVKAWEAVEKLYA